MTVSIALSFLIGFFVGGMIMFCLAGWCAGDEDRINLRNFQRHYARLTTNVFYAITISIVVCLILNFA